ncbi:MAG: aminotransferase class I/II-fold pyridoxal phosphate-dependent enzyme [Lachnospiraceae bacterium]|nr:aminotransferase class I/II-fold pyridoxal phosphate-dependent enzyme [Lachnospiraceae bacterium]
MEKRLYKELVNYSKSDYYPFHMPGHKRNISDFLNDAYAIDITEIDGFDNLHDAKGLIKEAEERAAKLYKSEETKFLVNGSTCGILSAISAVTKKGDKIIAARNCHKSVYNAIEINELKPIFIYPEIIGDERISSGITVSQIEKALLENRDAKAVIITSPTYDGIVSDIASISKLVHEFDIPLIVDEAHGALFYIEGRSAVINKADIVINSLHKTLPALTSTALIHINGNLVNRDEVKKYLSIYQTSSPSYVLMASIDYAVDVMERDGNKLYMQNCIRVMKLKEALKKLRNLKLITKDELLLNGVFDFDENKVIISTVNSKITGKELSDILLNKYHLRSEMSAVTYTLLMLTVMDSDEGIERLINALYEIDDSVAGNKESKQKICVDNSLEKLIGKKSDKTVYVYPPGIPIIVCGETVTEDIVKEINENIKAGLDVKGL